eukprot:gene642-209_t
MSILKRASVVPTLTAGVQVSLTSDNQFRSPWSPGHVGGRDDVPNFQDLKPKKLYSNRILLSENVVPSHYDLTLEPDLEACKYSGTVVITVNVDEPTSDISMHAFDLAIKKVFYTAVVDDKNKEFQAECWAVARTENRLKITWNENLPSGVGKITIDFDGNLNDQMAGFYRSDYKNEDGESKRMAVTQFEPIDARRAFPCWDEPGRKAVFKVTMIHDRKYTALSNMPEATVVNLKNGKKRTVFMETPIMSTYLLAFIVSDACIVECIVAAHCPQELPVFNQQPLNAVALLLPTPPGTILQLCLPWVHSGTPWGRALAVALAKSKRQSWNQRSKIVQFLQPATEWVLQKYNDCGQNECDKDVSVENTSSRGKLDEESERSMLEFIQGVTNNGTMVRVLCRPGKVDELHYALNMAIKGLEYYNDYFALPYPLPKVDLVAIPDFAAGAMENWGLITYREAKLFVTENTSVNMIQSTTFTLIHELAHQWFGNLVTMQWWDGLWLKEGFATFMQVYASDVALNPEWKVWEEYVANKGAAAFNTDALRSSHPIRAPLDSASKAEEIFDAITYYKGQAVIRMVFSILGPDHFRDGLRIYLNRHKYGNTETEHLWDAWQEVSGKPLHEIMDTWTQEVGFPVVFVESSADGDQTKLSLKQRWFLADGSQQAGDDKKLWQIPITWYNPKSGESKKHEPHFFTAKSEDYVIKADPSVWTIINKDRWAFFRTCYTPDQLKRIAADFNTEHLSVEDKIGLLNDAYALSQAGLMDPSGLIDLLRGCSAERNPDIIDEAIRALNLIAGPLQHIGDEKVLNKFHDFAKNLFLDGVKELGFDNKEGDDDNVKRLREKFLNYAASYCAEDNWVAEQAQERFNKFLADRNSISADGRRAIFKIMVKNGGEVVWNELYKMHASCTEASEFRDYYITMGCIKDPAMQQHTLEFAVGPEVRSQYLFLVFGGFDGDWARVRSAWLFKNFDRLEKLLGQTSMMLFKSICTYSGRGLYGGGDAQRVSDFWKARNMLQLEKSVKQTVEKIEINVKFVGQIKKSALIQADYKW